MELRYLDYKLMFLIIFNLLIYSFPIKQDVGAIKQDVDVIKQDVGVIDSHFNYLIILSLLFFSL